MLGKAGGDAWKEVPEIPSPGDGGCLRPHVHRSGSGVRFAAEHARPGHRLSGAARPPAFSGDTGSGSIRHTGPQRQADLG